MRRLFEISLAFLAGVYGTLLYFDMGYPPVYPEIHAYRQVFGWIWLAAFAVNVVILWRTRREVASD